MYFPPDLLLFVGMGVIIDSHVLSGDAVENKEVEKIEKSTIINVKKLALCEAWLVMSHDFINIIFDI